MNTPRKAEISKIREVSFSFLSYLLEGGEDQEKHIYWLQNAADWMRTATISHLRYYLREHGYDYHLAEHLFDEYMTFKKPLLEGVTK